ncbi:serine protease [Leptospira sp. 96542]|nr:serine protease [Leptospira sp. 96542]
MINFKFPIFLSIVIYFHIPVQIFASKKLGESVVQIKVTVQYPNFQQPWRYKNPETRYSTGIYVGENKVLVPAQAIYFFTNIEIKKKNSIKNYQTNLVKLDPDLGLALLKVKEKNFSEGLTPTLFSDKLSIPSVGYVIESNDTKVSEPKKVRIQKMEVDSYANGYLELPIVEVQSENKLEGIGELVLDEMQKSPQGILYNSKENGSKGGMIPNFAIRNFLDQTQNHLPFKGFKFKPLTDAHTRTFYGLSKDNEGVLIAELYPNSSADSVLKLEDVLLEVGNFKIDPKGNFEHPKFGTLDLNFLFHAGKEFGFSVGSKIQLKILRNKKIQVLQMELKKFPTNSIRVPYGNTRFEKPKFLITGGLIFQELSEAYLVEHGTQWRNRVSKEFLYLNDYYRIKRSNEEGKIIILTHVLPLAGNKSYHSYKQMILNQVNGEIILSLEDLKSKLKKSKNKFIKFEMNDGTEMIFKSDELSSLTKEALDSFRIPNESNF